MFEKHVRIDYGEAWFFGPYSVQNPMPPEAMKVSQLYIRTKDGIIALQRKCRKTIIWIAEKILEIFEYSVVGAQCVEDLLLVETINGTIQIKYTTIGYAVRFQEEGRVVEIEADNAEKLVDYLKEYLKKEKRPFYRAGVNVFYVFLS